MDPSGQKFIEIMVRMALPEIFLQILRRFALRPHTVSGNADPLAGILRRDLIEMRPQPLRPRMRSQIGKNSFHKRHWSSFPRHRLSPPMGSVFPFGPCKPGRSVSPTIPARIRPDKPRERCFHICFIILSEAKDLVQTMEIPRFAQDDNEDSTQMTNCPELCLARGQKYDYSDR